jgi:hypothetical protein
MVFNPLGKLGAAGKVEKMVGVARNSNKATKATRTLEGLDLAVANPKGLLHTDFSKNVRAYVRDMETRSGIKLTREQRGYLIQELKTRKFEKLDPSAKIKHSKEYNKFRTQLRKDWEQHSGEQWPFTMRPDKTTGRLKPVLNDFHHIIPQEMGGPHAWWNGIPLEFGKQHQGGVHVL